VKRHDFNQIEENVDFRKEEVIKLLGYVPIFIIIIQYQIFHVDFFVK
jgi:hypothetical protein